MQLGFGGSTFRYAAPAGTITSLEQVQGLRVATSYEVLVEGHLRAHGVDATVVHLDGAVESAVQLGVADVVADVVSTGTTLRGAGLEVFGDPILVSEAVLIPPRKVAEADVPAGVEVLSRRRQGVLTAHEYVLMDYDVPVSLVDRAVAITPGLEVAHGVSAARPGLGGGAGDGAPRPHEPGHGRPVRRGCARDPRDPDPRLAPLTSCRRWVVGGCETVAA